MREALKYALLAAFAAVSLPAQQPAPPVITNLNLTGNARNLRFTLYPAAQSYSILSATNPALPFAPDANFFTTAYTNVAGGGTNFGYEWRATNALSANAFYRVQATPLASNAVLAATVLNRLAYGPTPDELDRLSQTGPDAYIAEQLAPGNLAEDVESTHANFALIAAKFAGASNYVDNSNATMADLRAWHTLRAVGARRQLLEVMLQFLENHFVTQFSKSVMWFSIYFTDFNLEDRLATRLEYLENDRWRTALLAPQCTFYDLLQVSAESPAMILYLDTVTSRGNTTGFGINLRTNIANENYARELMELFTMGVDNGYDQNDITTMSRCWTGWTVDIVDPLNAGNPFALRTTTIIPGSTNTSTTTRSNLYGAWAFNYVSANHNTNAKAIFPGKTIPARFGAPYTTKTYGSNTIPGRYDLNIPAIATTNGLSEGYTILHHLADLPFTQEYISIKLCRIFVHDDFPNPSNDPNSPSYAFYNYAAGNLSPEAQLVRNCMLAWETNSPRGQIWRVLKTIFDSDLFRAPGAAQQKVKTPLEFTISTIRALRAYTNAVGGGPAGYTALTDGYSIQTPLTRMGGMQLFDRDSPDGYPETAAAWISAGTLAERVRFAQSFCTASGQNGHNGSQNNTGNDAAGSVSSPAGLVCARLPASSWTNAPVVVDYLLGLLFPGEGAGNLQFYRGTAISFLNTDVNGAASAFASLTVSGNAGSEYDNRLRGVVAMLMALPRFQEQ